MEFVNEQIAKGRLPADEYRTIRTHIIESQDDMKQLGAPSKFNAEWPFLIHLRNIGRSAADDWLKTDFDGVGRCSTHYLR